MQTHIFTYPNQKFGSWLVSAFDFQQYTNADMRDLARGVLGSGSREGKEKKQRQIT